MTTTTKTVFRQGDVILELRREGSTTVREIAERRGGRIILAEGEVTGHAHAVLDADAELYAVNEVERLLRAPTGATVVHEEHAPITLPPGEYIVRIQREYTPAEVRRVRD